MLKVKKNPDDYKCDKCEYTKYSLGNHIKHKADEHKPLVFCDKCDFKTMRKSDLSIHILFKHWLSLPFEVWTGDTLVV